jgi:hypothetical protein
MPDTDVAVVEAGTNDLLQTPRRTFAVDYHALLKKIAAAKLVCLTTWIPQDTVDELHPKIPVSFYDDTIRRACGRGRWSASHRSTRTSTVWSAALLTSPALAVAAARSKSPANCFRPDCNCSCGPTSGSRSPVSKKHDRSSLAHASRRVELS